ncbi:MAG: replicative DNA helicase [Chloroflexi bacterium]|nr:replicative DNA helicase [Chloroflexota bacterium]
MMDIETSTLPNRIAPNNIEAEQSVLGALLIDPDAIIKAVPIVHAEDFYLEKHKWIYEAIFALHERREPIDFVTVVSELEAHNKLNDVGGSAYITSLVNTVPSAINVESYAHLVERLSTQRRLISAAGDIAGIAYDSAEDIENTIDRAEEIIFAVAQRRMTRDMIPIRVAVDQFIDRLDYIQKHQGEILGVSTGFNDLDKLLGGFQPSDLIICAGRPGSGKTSFALSIVQFASMIKRKRVALFSLEMSAEQLVQRMVASMGNLDSQALRLGKLNDEDYPRLVKATGELAETTIFIDDSAAITPIEIRAKCRRLQSEHGLDMIIIDYLQLMTIRGRIENRVQEISQISRQLKELARELHVPVVALSQLSRAVEARDDHRPQLADLRESGCLTGDTLITRADTGERIPIRDLVAHGEPIPIIAMDENLRLRQATMTRAFPSGRKCVYEMRTRTGRAIRTSANHPFYRVNGWMPLEDLRVGDRLALPRALPEPTQPSMLSEDRLILLAHLIGDGCYVARQPLYYTNSDKLCLEAVASAASREFDVTPRWVKQENWYHIYLSANKHLTHGCHNPIAEWLQEMGIYGQRSPEKIIPAPIFKLNNAQVAFFLRHLWATDGNISRASSGRGTVIFYASTSRMLLEQIQHLLLRLDIQCTVRVNRKPGYRPTYHLHVQGRDDQCKFLTTIGAFGAKEPFARQTLSTLAEIPANPNYDVVPKEIWNEIESVRNARGWSLREMHHNLGWAHDGTNRRKHGVSRTRLNHIVDVLPDPRLELLAKSDIYWDEIVSIEDQGEEDVFDATVPGFHNFVANDFIVHNSIEQDADVVIFIFREKTYYPTLEKWQQKHPNKPYPENIAEIIVAKHRHGPIKDIQLFFAEDQATFRNLVTDPRA